MNHQYALGDKVYYLETWNMHTPWGHTIPPKKAIRHEATIEALTCPSEAFWVGPCYWVHCTSPYRFSGQAPEGQLLPRPEGT